MLALIKGFGLKAWGIAAAVVAVLVGLWRVYAAGKTAARVEGMEDQLSNVKERADVEDRVNRASDADRRKLRDKWTRD